MMASRPTRSRRSRLDPFKIFKPGTAVTVRSVEPDKGVRNCQGLVHKHADNKMVVYCIVDPYEKKLQTEELKEKWHGDLYRVYVEPSDIAEYDGDDAVVVELWKRYFAFHHPDTEALERGSKVLEEEKIITPCSVTSLSSVFGLARVASVASVARTTVESTALLNTPRGSRVLEEALVIHPRSNNVVDIDKPSPKAVEESLVDDDNNHDDHNSDEATATEAEEASVNDASREEEEAKEASGGICDEVVASSSVNHDSDEATATEAEEASVNDASREEEEGEEASVASSSVARLNTSQVTSSGTVGTSPIDLTRGNEDDSEDDEVQVVEPDGISSLRKKNCMNDDSDEDDSDEDDVQVVEPDGVASLRKKNCMNDDSDEDKEEEEEEDTSSTNHAVKSKDVISQELTDTEDEDDDILDLPVTKKAKKNAVKPKVLEEETVAEQQASKKKGKKKVLQSNLDSWLKKSSTNNAKSTVAEQQASKKKGKKKVLHSNLDSWLKKSSTNNAKSTNSTTVPSSKPPASSGSKSSLGKRQSSHRQEVLEEEAVAEQEGNTVDGKVKEDDNDADEDDSDHEDASTTNRPPTKKAPPKYSTAWLLDQASKTSKNGMNVGLEALIQQNRNENTKKGWLRALSALKTPGFKNRFNEQEKRLMLALYHGVGGRGTAAARETAYAWGMSITQIKNVAKAAEASGSTDVSEKDASQKVRSEKKEPKVDDDDEVDDDDDSDCEDGPRKICPMRIDSLALCIAAFPLYHAWITDHPKQTLPRNWVASNMAKLDEDLVAFDKTGKMQAFLDEKSAIQKRDFYLEKFAYFRGYMKAGVIKEREGSASLGEPTNRDPERYQPENEAYQQKRAAVDPNWRKATDEKKNKKKKEERRVERAENLAKYHAATSDPILSSYANIEDVANHLFYEKTDFEVDPSIPYMTHRLPFGAKTINEALQKCLQTKHSHVNFNTTWRPLSDDEAMEYLTSSSRNGIFSEANDRKKLRISRKRVRDSDFKMVQIIAFIGDEATGKDRLMLALETLFQKKIHKMVPVGSLGFRYTEAGAPSATFGEKQVCRLMMCYSERQFLEEVEAGKMVVNRTKEPMHPSMRKHYNMEIWDSKTWKPVKLPDNPISLPVPVKRKAEAEGEEEAHPAKKSKTQTNMYDFFEKK